MIKREVQLCIWFRTNPYKYVNKFNYSYIEGLKENENRFLKCIKDSIGTKFSNLTYDVESGENDIKVIVYLNQSYFKNIKETLENIIKEIYYSRFFNPDVNDPDDPDWCFDPGRILYIICNINSISNPFVQNEFIDVTIENDIIKYIPFNINRKLDSFNDDEKWHDANILYKHLEIPKNTIIFKRYHDILNPLNSDYHFKLQYILPLYFNETVHYDKNIIGSGLFECIEKTVNEELIKQIEEEEENEI